MTKPFVPLNMQEPRSYIVVAGDSDIQTVVDRAFLANQGQLPLEALTRTLVGRFNFDPLLLFAQEDPNLVTNIDLGYKAYEVKNGIVYQGFHK